MSRPFNLALCLFTLILLLPALSSGAGLYKWTDNQGNIHYGDKPPAEARLQIIKGNISSFTTVNVEPFVFDPTIITPTARSKHKTVVMYSTSWCGYCKKARAHFKRNDIPFQEHDIEKSEKAARAYKKLNGKGVPVILIGDRRMNGFRAETFDSIYYDTS